LEAVYNWRSDVSSLHLWSTLRRIPPIEEFAEEFSQLVSTTNYFLVCAQDSAQPIGFVYAYNSSSVDGYAFFSQFMSERFRRGPHAVEAGLLFLRYLFSFYNLRKLYADVYEFNQIAFKTLTNAGFQSEGFTPEHILYSGTYWGMHRLALYRSDWEKLADRMAKLLGRRAKQDPVTSLWLDALKQEFATTHAGELQR
jgi:RimJ/RimL family protein N-acetyltransferase